MRDIVFNEFRDRNNELRNLDDQNKEEAFEKIATAVETIVRYDNKARNEGLLCLEGEVYDLDDDDDLKNIVMLVVNGTDAVEVEEISLFKYFSEGLTGADAVCYLVSLLGMLSVQQAENPTILEEKLLACIPQKAAAIYRKRTERPLELTNYIEPETNYDGRKYDASVLEKFYEGGIAVSPEDSCYYLLKITDYALIHLDDRSVQRLLRDVEYAKMEMALIGLSGAARKKIFDNLSLRLAVMFAEDIEFIGPVQMKDLEKAVGNVFSILTKLIEYGEIESPDEESYSFFLKLYKISKDEELEKKRQQTDQELYDILREYAEGKTKIITGSWHEE